MVTNIYVRRGKKISKNHIFFEVQQHSIEKEHREKFYCFVPILQGDRIREGMRVKIFPWALGGDKKKAILGRVERLSYLPASEAYFNRIFLDKSYHDFFTKGSPVIPVIVVPLYEESNRKEPLAEEIPLGSFATIDVILQERKPITYLFPYWFSKKDKK